MDDITIGIDLGTTNSCAACYVNERVKILENCEGGRITPSFLYFTEKDAPIVGQFAKHMANAKPEYGVYEIKRLVGRKYDDPYVQNNLQYFSFQVESQSNEPLIVIERPVGSLKKTPQELCAAILKKIKKDVENKLGQAVTKAVITVPAYFNIRQREVTLAAANKAGFTVLKLLNEPTAAALTYYLENECEEENYSLVYDLGGGTFDVAILKRNSRNIDIVCVDGDTHLGGQDFDNLIIDHVCDVLMNKYKYNPKTERRTMRRLHNQCEEAKKTLSVVDETTVILNGFVKNHQTIEIPLTRAQFEEMADTFFKKTITIVDNCLKSSNLQKSDIKEVILSGGSTRIPKIQNMLSSFFDGKKLNKFVNPDECVAEGAALQAAMLSNNPKQTIKEIQITDVTPLSLGLRNFVDMMTFLIKRNTPLPIHQTSTRITVYNNQKTMGFDVYEGERLDAKKNHCLGKMTIEDITPAPPGQCEVVFTMSIDENGILHIKAEERRSSNVKGLKITYTRGHRSDREVKNALKDAEDNKEEDERFRKFCYQKEYLLNYCIRAMYNFEDKDLVESCRNAYDLCRSIKNRAENMHVGNEPEIKKMTEEIKQKCDSIVTHHEFKYMPTFRT